MKDKTGHVSILTWHLETCIEAGAWGLENRIQAIRGSTYANKTKSRKDSSTCLKVCMLLGSPSRSAVHVGSSKACFPFGKQVQSAVRIRYSISHHLPISVSERVSKDCSSRELPGEHPYMRP